ncbi:MAG: cation:proton antiporter [Ignavibacteriaceae bacterium]
MEQFTIIKDIVIILAVSLGIIFLFKKLNIPSIIGFLVAGVLIGPFGFKLISKIDDIEMMAEVGVILLLFTIGLEVSFTRLMRMRRFLLLSGGLQVILTILFSSIVFFLFGVSVPQSIYFGMLISLSSTAIVLKILSDKKELETPYGKISLGILIFQDLAIVPMFLFLPVLGAEAMSFGQIILRLLFAFGAVAVILLLAKFLMPLILFQLAKLRLREAFTVGIILLLLGTAYLTHEIGLSFALGAFIAGLILSESEFSPQIAAEILPLKDAFNSIFFVSIGLLLNIPFVINYPVTLAGITLGIILVKSSIIIIIVKYMRYPLRVAILTGLALAQIGEFSFILSQAGLRYNLIDADFYNAFLASSIFTMFLTPFLLQLAPHIAGRAGKMEPVKLLIDPEKRKRLKHHVIIVGFGLNGRNVARVLKETGISYIVIELNPETVKEESAKGENIIFGDITQEEILHHTMIEFANVIVFAISDSLATRRGLQVAKKLNPKIYAIVRTRYTNELDDLMKLGANDVIPEEFETSLQIFAKVLEKYHIPLNVIMKQVALLRGESYSLMIKEDVNVHSFVHLDEILAAGLTETFYITEDNIHAGKTLAQINLRAITDATIIALVRTGKNIYNPSGREVIKPHDTLVITGTHQSVDKAFEYLDQVVRQSV